jgi:AAA15 family ATPase/GTPase
MMMLEQFTVENFKAFKHLELKDLGHINIFVGENNAGKTSLLQAIAINLIVESLKAQDTMLKIPEVSLSNSEFKPLTSIASVPQLLSRNIRYNFQLAQVVVSMEFKNKDNQTTSVSTSKNLLPPKPMKFWFKLKGESLQENILSLVRTDFIKQIDNNQTDLMLIIEGDFENNLLLSSQEKPDISSSDLLNYDNCLYIPASADFKKMASNNLAKVKRLVQKEIIALLKKNIEPSLEEVFYGVNNKLNVLLNTGFELPLENMGDGFAKLLGLACCLEQEGSQYLCIDEPENGFHYKTQTSFWKLLANWSLEGDKQSFIATHSYELISCLNDLLTADPTLLERGLKVRVHRLERDEADPEKINVITMTEEGLSTLIAMNLEIR